MRRTVILLVLWAIVLCAGVVALVTAEKPAEAAFPGQNAKIAFQGYRDDGMGNSTSEIITVFPDGTGARQLTSASGSGDPTFSADGTKIAYAGSSSSNESDNDIYVMNRFGNGKTPLTHNDLPEYGPTWSPDGSKIAFIRQELVPDPDDPDGGFDWQIDIWVMNADGSGQVNITDDDAFEAGPTWSPDGSKIAFDKGGDLWVMNPDGSEQRNVTNTGYVNGRYVGEYDPDWSPDGKKLAFASNRHYNKYEVYTMNLDGTGLTNVTNTRYVNEEDCVWSPSGTRIAYRKDLTENAEIFTKNADGSGAPKNVSNDPKYNESPDWGPKPTTTR
jgi:dipeptidyl aminopeptidase/acylaminoacyl peptidase